MLVPLAPLLARSRADLSRYASGLTLLCVPSFALFALFPVEGPRPELAPEITGRYRAGDVRHCFADIGRARDLLGFEPCRSFAQGIEELAVWLGGATAVDRVDQATEELVRRGLVA